MQPSSLLLWPKPRHLTAAWKVGVRAQLPCTTRWTAAAAAACRRRLLPLPLLPPPLQLNTCAHPWPSIYAAGTTGALLLALLTSDGSSLCGEGEEGSPEQAERLFRSARAALDACCAAVSMLVIRSVVVWAGAEERPGGVFAAAASCIRKGMLQSAAASLLGAAHLLPRRSDPCPCRLTPAARGGGAGLAGAWL